MRVVMHCVQLQYKNRFWTVWITRMNDNCYYSWRRIRERETGKLRSVRGFGECFLWVRLFLSFFLDLYPKFHVFQHVQNEVTKFLENLIFRLGGFGHPNSFTQTKLRGNAPVISDDYLYSTLPVLLSESTYTGKLKSWIVESWNLQNIINSFHLRSSVACLSQASSIRELNMWAGWIFWLAHCLNLLDLQTLERLPPPCCASGPTTGWASSVWFHPENYTFGVAHPTDKRTARQKIWRHKVTGLRTIRPGEI